MSEYRNWESYNLKNTEGEFDEKEIANFLDSINYRLEIQVKDGIISKAQKDEIYRQYQEQYTQLLKESRAKISEIDEKIKKTREDYERKEGTMKLLLDKLARAAASNVWYLELTEEETILREELSKQMQDASIDNGESDDPMDIKIRALFRKFTTNKSKVNTDGQQAKIEDGINGNNARLIGFKRQFGNQKDIAGED